MGQSVSLGAGDCFRGGDLFGSEPKGLIHTQMKQMNFRRISANARKLTKEYFMSLGNGPFLVVDGGDSRNPLFAEAVTLKPHREAQWDRIKGARVDGKLCELYLSCEAYEWQRERRQIR
jgi:hypothetical protein